MECCSACCSGRPCAFEDESMTAPTCIGPYEIIRRIGKSMTEVYLAFDTAADRKVALKLVPPGDDRTTQLIVEAERRGAAIQKVMHHLGTRMVEIYDFGDLVGYYFVTMLFIESRTFADILAAVSYGDTSLQSLNARLTS